MNVQRFFLVMCWGVLWNDGLWPDQCAGQAKPGQLSREQRAALVPGLQAEFTTNVSGHVDRDTRIDRFAALFVGPGESPSDFLAAGAFQARYSGFVKLKLKGRFQFRMVGRGQMTLKLNDQVVFAGVRGDFADARPIEVDLVKGYNAIEIDYASQADGTGQFRLYWSGEEFVAEPLPSTLLFAMGDSADLMRGRRLRRGKELVESHLCLRCHAMPAEIENARHESVHRPDDRFVASLPADAPDWKQIERRIDSDWLKLWLLDPAALRNETRMPKVLAHLSAEKADQAAADIAKFVLKSADAGADLPDAQGESKRGGKLFEDRGCIACHRFTPAADIDEYQRVSLDFVAAKFVSGGLQSFLLNPRAHYRSSRMPVPDLSPGEAGDLEVFLREFSTGKVERPFPDGDAARGERLASELGCLNCHSVAEQQRAEPVQHGGIFAREEYGGCLAAATDRAKNLSPRYEFDEEMKQAIVDFLRTDGRGLRQKNPAEYANRQFVELRCNACHRRDAEDSAYFYVLQEEGVQGLAPDAVPDLTTAGEKLLSDWMQKQFAGGLPYRTREHYRIRMPAFPDCAQELAVGIAAQHGFGPQEDRRPDFSRQLAEAGERIAAMEVGLGCRRCHAINELKPIAPFDAYSTNLGYAADRLRYEYYTRWMFNPQRVDATTRMLKFSPDLKTTGFESEFDGDAAKQFEALWHYLHAIEQKSEKIYQK